MNNFNNNNLGININNMMFNNGNGQFFNPYQYQRNIPMVNNMMNINNFNVNNGNLNNQILYIVNNYFNNCNYNFIGNMNNNYM